LILSLIFLIIVLGKQQRGGMAVKPLTIHYDGDLLRAYCDEPDINERCSENEEFVATFDGWIEEYAEFLIEMFIYRIMKNIFRRKQWG
jgi:hypothetical protein